MVEVRLEPLFDARDVRVRMSVGGRTLLTHRGTKAQEPALVSLVELGRSLEAPGSYSILRCACADPLCEEIPTPVAVHLAGNTATWTIGYGDNPTTFVFDAGQAGSELAGARERIRAEIARTNGRCSRFHPETDALAFGLPMASHGSFLRHNLVYVGGVGAFAAALTRLFA